MQQPQILQPLRHMVFPSVLMVFSLHFVFGQGSFLLRNKFRLPFAEKHFPSLINNAAANPQLPSRCIFSIHSVWVCGMMIFSLPDIFSPSSCSLLLQKFPQNYSPHWTMLISSPSPGEKSGVWSLVTQPRIQAETQCACGDHVGLALRESVKVGLSSSSAVLYHSCLSGCVPAHLLALWNSHLLTLFTHRCWCWGFIGSLLAQLPPALLLGCKKRAEMLLLIKLM